jgi:metal-responsive CopG/Arc/MetJ family transcriptional regulator
MESITIKVDKEFAREMDSAMKKGYSTKTEFIREAIRDKIKKIRYENIRPELLKYFGKAKRKTTYKEERKAREEAGNEIAREFGIDLD